MSREIQKRIESLELWFMRRMMRISWTKKISNNRIRKMIKERGGWQLNLNRELRKRKVEYCGHIIRKKGLTKLTTIGKTCGKRGRGRPRRTWIADIKDWCGWTSITDLIRGAEDRRRWASRLHTTPWMRDVT